MNHRVDTLLQLPARELIFEAIRSSPGIPLRRLRDEINGPRFAYGTLAYHLRIMERSQLIVSKRQGRYRRYFESGSGLGANAAVVALLKTQPLPLVARAVLDNPGLTQGDLWHALGSAFGATRQTLSYHLRRLLESGLVAVEREGRFRRYRATERLQRLASFVAPAGPSPGPAVPVPAMGSDAREPRGPSAAECPPAHAS